MSTFDFTNRNEYQLSNFKPLCPGDDSCQTDTYHMPNCPKLARDLQTWKNREMSLTKG